MKLTDFYDDDLYDDYLEDDEEENQKAYLARLRKNARNQDKKHKKTTKPRRQDQKQDNQEFDYDNFLKSLRD